MWRLLNWTNHCSSFIGWTVIVGVENLARWWFDKVINQMKCNSFGLQFFLNFFFSSLTSHGLEFGPRNLIKCLEESNSVLQISKWQLALPKSLYILSNCRLGLHIWLGWTFCKFFFFTDPFSSFYGLQKFKSKPIINFKSMNSDIPFSF